MLTFRFDTAIIPPIFLQKWLRYLGNYGNDVIRFTKKEQIQVRNIPEEYLPDIYSFFKKLGVYQIDYPVVVTNLTCCTGSRYLPPRHLFAKGCHRRYRQATSQ